MRLTWVDFPALGLALARRSGHLNNGSDDVELLLDLLIIVFRENEKIGSLKLRYF